jgi:sigma-54 dependent transcriptional regulator, acetoin dehydrogenase operon transcriptional activator AcoR
MLNNPFYNLENPELMRYEYAWVNFVKNDIIIESIIPSLILESWKRCKSHNVNYLMRTLPDIPELNSDIEQRIENNLELLNISTPIMETLINMVDEKDLSVQIVDNGGFFLKNIQKGGLISEADRAYQIGRNVREEIIGTNSFDLSARQRKQFSVVGSEHYCQIFQRKAVYTSPIFNKEGDIAAIIGMTIELEKSSPYMLGMVAATAKAIENEFQLKEVYSQLVTQNVEQQNILDTVTDGIIYINDKLQITQANREMSLMTGLSKEEMIGKNISFLQTAPKLTSIITSLTEGMNVGQVRINGNKKSYNCFLNHRFIEGQKAGSSNRVFVFIRLEEIQELANKMNQENRAFFTFEDITGKSLPIIEAIDLAKKASEHGARVIIEGESGTGKEMFAQSIHNNGIRKRGPFVAVDCGAIPRELLESELFGYEEGAYTGARKGGHRGKFELADKGTLFLDEISNMPIDMQAKMLRVLQENKIMRIGGYIPIPVDVQIIAASNQDLKKEVEKGNFREDLFYRLNIVYIKLPSLRERKSDIPILMHNLINNYKNLAYKKIKRIDDEVVEILSRYDWPGNVRQLNNVVERMMIISKTDMITKDLIPIEILEAVNLNVSLPKRGLKIETLDSASAKYVKSVVESLNGNIKKASEELDISRATVYRLMKKL